MFIVVKYPIVRLTLELDWPFVKFSTLLRWRLGRKMSKVTHFFVIIPLNSVNLISRGVSLLWKSTVVDAGILKSVRGIN